MSFLNTIFGGSNSKSTSQSGNTAYPWAMSTFGSGAGTDFNAGSTALQGLLGVGGDPASAGKGLEGYFDSAGGQFQLNQGLDALTSKYSALGLDRSGAAMKGMEEFRQGLASTYEQNYINNLLGLSKLGLGAGSLVTDAGQFSKSSGTGSQSSGGLGQFLGQVLPLALSFI
jgi:hypothetical protein